MANIKGERADRGPASVRFLDPQFVSQIARLDLKAKLVVEGFITGLHRSPYHGFSVEFAEHRQYMPGDSIKYIDWKVYAKRDRFYVKTFEEETNLKAYLLLDVSSSMNYPLSGGVTKLQYAVHLAAALSYLMLKQKDSVGLLSFTDKPVKFVPPRSVREQLKVILTELEAVQSGLGGKTNISDCLHNLADRIKRRGLIILLSDLWGDPSRVTTALKHFRHKKHEVIVFHVLHPHEIDFPFREEATFVDLETREETVIQAWEIYKEYLSKYSDWTTHYRRECQENRIDYTLLDTSVPFEIALFHYLEKRKRLH
jgi:uncharacterized protein (DUF58 family)